MTATGFPSNPFRVRDLVTTETGLIYRVSGVRDDRVTVLLHADAGDISHSWSQEWFKHDIFKLKGREERLEPLALDLVADYQTDTA